MSGGLLEMMWKRMVVMCGVLLAAVLACGETPGPAVSNACNLTVDDQHVQIVATDKQAAEADTMLNCNNTVQIGDEEDTEAYSHTCVCPAGWVLDGDGCAKRCESSTTCGGGSNCVGGACVGLTDLGDMVCVFNSTCGAAANALLNALGTCSTTPCDDYNECTIDALTPMGCVYDFATPGILCADGGGACSTTGWCVLPDL
jgi:hypothetical protein